MNDLFEESYLFFAIRNLIDGAVKDEDNAVRSASEAALAAYNSRREQLLIFLPELPQQVRVSIAALLDDSAVLDLALDDHVELFVLAFVHPYLPTGVVDHDARGGLLAVGVVLDLL